MGNAFCDDLRRRVFLKDPRVVVLPLIAGILVLEGCNPAQKNASAPTPAAVDGSVYVLVSNGTTGQKIVLPDLEVALLNVATGDESAPVTTDLYGRYQFPE